MINIFTKFTSINIEYSVGRLKVLGMKLKLLYPN